MSAPSEGAASFDGGGDSGGSTTGEGGAASCGSGQLECSGVCVPEDVQNCGACGHSCTGLAHVSGATACTAGACSFAPSACAAGWADCDGKADDGCETDVTLPAECGSCTATACPSNLPVCQQTGATYACASGCSGPTPTLCSGTCTDTTSDAKNCNGCGHTCTAPPSGKGQSTCSASACQLKCNQGYQASGTDCVAVSDLYVSVATGNDTNAGTLAAPLKTMSLGLYLATAGATVHVLAGTYTESQGGEEPFFTVPVGVTLESYGGGTVTVAGPGGNTGVATLGVGFAGNGTIRGISVVGCDVPIGSNAFGGSVDGTQLLDTVDTSQDTGQLTVRGGSAMSIVNSKLGPVYVTEAASLSIQSGTITSVGSNCGASDWGPVQLQTSGTVTISGTTVLMPTTTGGDNAAISVRGTGLAKVTGTNITNPCALVAVYVYAGASAELDGDTIAGASIVNNGAVTINGGSFMGRPSQYALGGGLASAGSSDSLKVRNATFLGQLGVILDGDLTGGGTESIDFGTATSPGGNSFQGITQDAFDEIYTNHVVSLAGNTWIPNVQGADSSGHFAAGSTMKGPSTCTNGAPCNVGLVDVTDVATF